MRREPKATCARARAGWIGPVGRAVGWAWAGACKPGARSAPSYGTCISGVTRRTTRLDWLDVGSGLASGLGSGVGSGVASESSVVPAAASSVGVGAGVDASTQRAILSSACSTHRTQKSRVNTGGSTQGRDGEQRARWHERSVGRSAGVFPPHLQVRARVRCRAVPGRPPHL